MPTTNGPKPIDVLSDSPHYFTFNDRPIILICSDAAYGIILDRTYDFRIFLHTIAASGMNFTRVYTGATPPFWFGPPSILPWHREMASGKFDLNRWDEAYFARLTDFAALAEHLGVIVDICFFNGTGSFQGDRYNRPMMALNPANNLQGIGSADARDVISVKDPELLAVETRYVTEITRRLNRFSNVIYDVADEPDNVGDDRLEDYTAWQEHILNVCYHAEDDLPGRHPISVCAAGKNWKLKNFATDPSTSHMISWISIEYTEFDKLDSHRRYNRPVVLIESARYSSDGRPNREYNGTDADAINSSRAESWEFLLGGAAGHMQFNCDWGYTEPKPVPNNPSAAGTTTPVLLRQKKVLKRFMESLNFIRMSPAQVHGLPAGAIARAIAEPGKQYAVYLHHSHISRGPWPDFAAYTVDYGDYAGLTIEVPDVPPGRYQLNWIDPASGNIILTEVMIHGGEVLRLGVPRHSYDIALKILGSNE